MAMGGMNGTSSGIFLRVRQRERDGEAGWGRTTCIYIWMKNHVRS